MMAEVLASIPDYLNHEFLEKSLKNGLQSDVVIKDFVIKNATAGGDNYMSDVFRIKIDYCINGVEQQVSLIVKSMPDTEFRGPIVAELNVYDKEVEVFVDIVPEFSKLINEFFAAKCFYATRLPEKMIVFQDLQSLGFQMAARHSGLNYNHCELIMKKIGKFHAASMVFAEKEPEKIRKYNYNFYDPNEENPSNMVPDFFFKRIEHFAKIAEKWDDLDREIVEKLKNLVPVFNDKLKKCMTLDNSNGVNVLNHGDLWINNMMFNYGSGDDKNKPEDVAFVDFQICYYYSPGLDLNYCLNTCPSYEVRENRMDDLIHVYYNSLTEVLTDLKYKNIPTFDDILKEIEKVQFYGFVAAIAVLPIVVMEKLDEKLNVDTLMNEESSERIREHSYNGQVYQKTIKQILKRYNKMKVLDL